MYATPQHSIDKALGKFELIDGAGDGEITACAVTMLGWLAGHKQWSTRLVCANYQITAIVIAGNDYNDNKLPRYKKGPKQGRLNKRGEERVKARRVNLVKLGYEGGVLDTWWIPDTIIDWIVDTTKEEKNEYTRAVAVLKMVIKWKKTRHRMEHKYKSGRAEWIKVS